MKKFLDYLKKEKIIESFIGLLEEKISQSHHVLIKEYLLELENFSNECKTFENEEFTIVLFLLDMNMPEGTYFI